MTILSNKARKAQLLGGTGIAAALALSLTGTASAQDAAVDDTTFEEVVVTGSRIVSPDIASVSPVHVIGGETIRQSGVANIQDLLLSDAGLMPCNIVFHISSLSIADTRYQKEYGATN